MTSCHKCGRHLTTPEDIPLVATIAPQNSTIDDPTATTARLCETCLETALDLLDQWWDEFLQPRGKEDESL